MAGRMTEPFSKRAEQALGNSDLRTNLTRSFARLQRSRGLAFDDLATSWPDLQAAAAAVRRGALDNLPQLLRQLEDQLVRRGVQVVWASDGETAIRTIAALATARGADTVVRSRSPLAEEIGLDAALATAGIGVINSHFGDFIQQLAADRPSHPRFPALHQSAAAVAALFEDKLDMPQTLDVQAMGSMARFRLQRALLSHDMMISEVELAAADHGLLALISDAGEERLGASLARVQVLLMGLEQVTATLEELLFLTQMASRSANGRHFPGALTLFHGPAQGDDADGPGEVHLILVDNGRSSLLQTRYRDVLACIGCGACHNVCPVTREIGGHAYGDDRAGPIGAVRAPLLARSKPARGNKQNSTGWPAPAEIPLLDAGFVDLPLASTLCGACADVCPVGIDLPQMLIWLREARVDAGLAHADERALRAVYGRAGSSPAGFRRLRGLVRRDWLGALLPPLRRWRAGRNLPPPASRSFRDRWQEREGP